MRARPPQRYSRNGRSCDGWGPIKWPVAADSGAMHAADVRQGVAAARLMHQTAVVPDRQITVAPAMAIAEARLQHEIEQPVEQRLGVGIGHVGNADGEARRYV